MTDDTERQIDFDDALARVFSKVHAATKDAWNPHFKNKYATLESIHRACREVLTAEGFSFPQTLDMRMNEGKREVIVTTHLRRKGLSISSALPMPVEKDTAQGIGSAITYGRRYGLAAAVGISSDEDDDGAKASESGKSNEDHPLMEELYKLTDQVAEVCGVSSDEAKRMVANRSKAKLSNPLTVHDIRTLIAAAKAIINDEPE